MSKTYNVFFKIETVYIPKESPLFGKVETAETLEENVLTHNYGLSCWALEELEHARDRIIQEALAGKPHGFYSILVDADISGGSQPGGEEGWSELYVNTSYPYRLSRADILPEELEKYTNEELSLLFEETSTNPTYNFLAGFKSKVTT